ncbi:SpoIVB peptidase [uncultured Flavonifractor sp.]|uniref:SpoIVB peptidase n=1 Tax=uncultured Flavonifractor sp. TaxID=1193534 RepID=UPI002616D77F|nr:SpoIVB peptidase [uncultured Flavonifractor sp.]
MKEEQKTRPWVAAALAAALIFTSLALTQPARAADSARTVIPVGRAVGIKLFSDGVMVVGFSEVASEQGRSVPARDCGLREGDIITHINQEEVDTIEQVQQVLQEVGGQAMSIRALRADETVQFTAQAVQCSSDGQYKLGAWIRDSMAGIGTITYWDPASGVFGALGHGINDVETAQLMPLQSGSILYSQVADVKKGEKGEPGELKGAFQVDRDLGSLYANTPGGVFGVLSDSGFFQETQPVEVASRSEVHTGPAVIRSNVAGEATEEYEIEIIRIFPQNEQDTRNLMLKVTDARLLDATGGIVQGMSGSPILQDGKLVGAVTHVLINDPTQGYGILAENMLQMSAG